jgi:hypothetical protein
VISPHAGAGEYPEALRGGRGGTEARFLPTRERGEYPEALRGGRGARRSPSVPGFDFRLLSRDSLRAVDRRYCPSQTLGSVFDRQV